MEDHEEGTATSANINSTEDELESLSSSTQPPPAFDSFAWLAIGLSLAVSAASAYYFRKSKQQLEGTLKTLKEG
jgi:hypothetical protein